MWFLVAFVMKMNVYETHRSSDVKKVTLNLGRRGGAARSNAYFCIELSTSVDACTI